MFQYPMLLASLMILILGVAMYIGGLFMGMNHGTPCETEKDRVGMFISNTGITVMYIGLIVLVIALYKLPAGTLTTPIPGPICTIK